MVYSEIGLVSKLGTMLLKDFDYGKSLKLGEVKITKHAMSYDFVNTRTGQKLKIPFTFFSLMQKYPSLVEYIMRNSRLSDIYYLYSNTKSGTRDTFANYYFATPELFLNPAFRAFFPFEESLNDIHFTSNYMENIEDVGKAFPLDSFSEDAGWVQEIRANLARWSASRALDAFRKAKANNEPWVEYPGMDEFESLLIKITQTGMKANRDEGNAEAMRLLPDLERIVNHYSKWRKLMDTRAGVFMQHYFSYPMKDDEAIKALKAFINAYDDFVSANVGTEFSSIGIKNGTAADTTYYLLDEDSPYFTYLPNKVSKDGTLDPRVIDAFVKDAKAHPEKKNILFVGGHMGWNTSTNTDNGWKLFEKYFDGDISASDGSIWISPKIDYANGEMRIRLIKMEKAAPKLPFFLLENPDATDWKEEYYHDKVIGAANEVSDTSSIVQLSLCTPFNFIRENEKKLKDGAKIVGFQSALLVAYGDDALDGNNIENIPRQKDYKSHKYDAAFKLVDDFRRGKADFSFYYLPIKKDKHGYYINPFGKERYTKYRRNTVPAWVSDSRRLAFLVEATQLLGSLGDDFFNPKVDEIVAANRIENSYVYLIKSDYLNKHPKFYFLTSTFPVDESSGHPLWNLLH